VAFLLARVLAAIEESVASVATIKCSLPSVFFRRVLVLRRQAAFSRLPTLQAGEQSLDLATIATRLNWHFAATTKTFMAAAIAVMFATGHDISTWLSTTPPIHIVCINASSRNLILTTEASLSWSHV
jgi:hypothetical protein